MASVFGHRKCKSLKEVTPKDMYDVHAHGKITRGGKISGVKEPMLLVTDAEGNIIAATAITMDINISGTLTASKIVGAVYE